MHLRSSSLKWRPFCLGGGGVSQVHDIKMLQIDEILMENITMTS